MRQLNISVKLAAFLLAIWNVLCLKRGSASDYSKNIFLCFEMLHIDSQAHSTSYRLGNGDPSVDVQRQEHEASHLHSELWLGVSEV